MEEGGGQKNLVLFSLYIETEIFHTAHTHTHTQTYRHAFSIPRLYNFRYVHYSERDRDQSIHRQDGRKIRRGIGCRS